VSAFIKGLRLPFSAAGFLLANRGLKRYAILPLIFNILIYGLVIVLFMHFLWSWDIYHVSWDFLGPVGRWLSAAVNWLGWLVKLAMAAAALAAAFFTFTAVGMAVASPLNDILSEKSEMVCLGGVEKMAMPFRFTTRAALLSAGDSLRNLVKQLFFTVIVLPFLLIPVVGFVPLFLVGGYFAGFGFLDSAMARNFLRPKHKRLFSDKRFWEIVGFGAAMQALFAVPFLGMLLMPVGVVAGTLLYCGEDWEKLLADAHLPNPPGFIPPRTTPFPASAPEKPS
jgi:CysZ protein